MLFQVKKHWSPLNIVSNNNTNIMVKWKKIFLLIAFNSPVNKKGTNTRHGMPFPSGTIHRLQLMTPWSPAWNLRCLRLRNWIPKTTLTLWRSTSVLAEHDRRNIAPDYLQKANGTVQVCNTFTFTFCPLLLYTTINGCFTLVRLDTVIGPDVANHITHETGNHIFLHTKLCRGLTESKLLVSTSKLSA